LLYADRRLGVKKGYSLRRTGGRKIFPAWNPGTPQATRGPFLCDYLRSIKEALRDKEFRPRELREILIELAWGNRDILPAHMEYFSGALVIPAKEWNRSTEWDNVLGYFDPQDRCLKLHAELLANPSRLREDLMIALGESLLGRYIEKRRWIEQQGARRYEITLRPVRERQCYLSDSQLHAYLRLARMTPDSVDRTVHRITINPDGGFLPPGLLFGLTYAWYLSGQGLTMKYEMTLLRWPLKSLIPLHAKDRIRKEALVTFFRTEVFDHQKC